jgi:hypothetical protein
MTLSITINKDTQHNGTTYRMFYAEWHSVEFCGAIGVTLPVRKDDMGQGILTEGEGSVQLTPSLRSLVL